MSYAGLAALFVTFAALVCLMAGVRCRPPRQWWLATGGTITVLLVLTVVFDSLMIMADLFRFDESFLLGVYVWRAPVEDLAWPVAASLLLPSVRVLLSSSRSADAG